MSDISGVTFTVNPLTGSEKQIVTESSWGMGAAIVDGRVTPDHYTMNRKLELCEKKIAEKRFMVPPRIDKNSKNRILKVPNEIKNKETLSLDEIQLITKWAIKAEEYFKSPQDIEWTISNGKFYILQSRDVTVSGQNKIGQNIKGRYVIFKPILENFTEPLTPLTADILSIETLLVSH